MEAETIGAAYTPNFYAAPRQGKLAQVDDLSSLNSYIHPTALRGSFFPLPHIRLNSMPV